MAGVSTLISNTVTVISSILPALPAISATCVSKSISIVGDGIFYFIYFSTSLSGPWRGKSNHQVSVEQHTKISTHPIATFIEDNLFGDNITFDNILSSIQEFIGEESSDNVKSLRISGVLEYNVKMGNELVPLIYLLYSNLSNLSDADASKLLNFYYLNTIKNTDNKEQFNNYLTRGKSCYNNTVLDYCKCLAIMNNVNEPYEKELMGVELATALNSAKTDQQSNWFILNKPNHFRNFVLRFISGTILYLGSSVSLALITPIGSFFVITGLYTAKRVFDQRFANSYSHRANAY